jgi:hypothetical protein
MTRPATEPDARVRSASLEHVRRLSALHDQLTARDLEPGFTFDGQRTHKTAIDAKRYPPALSRP